MTLIRRYPIIPLIIFLSLSSGAPASAAPGPGLFWTLNQSIERGLSENNKLKVARDRVVQADQVEKQAFSEFLPKFSTTYGYKRLDEPQTFDLVFPHAAPVSAEISTVDNFQWTGTVSQTIFKGFGLVGSYRWARLGLDRARAEADLDKIDLALKIKQAYFNVLAADKTVQVADQAVASLTAHVNTAQNFYELEMIPVNELLKAQVQLGNAQYDRVKAVNAARQSRAVFNTLLLLPIDTPISLEDILAFAPVEKGYDACLAQALKQRPEIRSIQLAILQSDQQIRIARSRMYPEIDLQYRYIKEGDSPDVSGSDFHEPNRWEASAVLSWTLWDWGKAHYTAGERKGKRDELRHMKAMVEEDIRLEIKNALLKLDEANENIPKAAEAVKQGEENLRVSTERFNAKAAASTEVLDAQSLLTQARFNYYRAIYDYNLAKAGLERALGSY